MTPLSASPPSPSAWPRLPGIDGLRGVAALGIVGWHQLGFTVGHPLLGHAYKGVGLFFMISGFVMAASYEAQLRRGLGPWTFGVLRLARLYPLYLVGTLLGLLLALLGLGLKAVGPAEAMRALPAALVFWPGALNGDPHLFPLDAPGWSLYLELAACVAYAFLLPVLSRRLLAFGVVAGFVLVELQLGHWGNLDGGWNRDSFGVGLARVSFAFPAGVLLYRLRSTGKLPRVRLPVWAVCMGFTLVIALPNLGGWDALLELAISGLVSPSLVVLAADAAYGPRQAWAARALGTPSYALYALHFPVLVAFHRLYPEPGTAATTAAGVFSLALVWLLATAATRWIDDPLRRAVARWRTRRAHAEAGTGPLPESTACA